MTRPNPRPGFTLLEVLLSLAIAVLLMAALFVALEINTRATDEGREIVEQSTLARSLLLKIANDITASMGPVQAAQQSSSSGSGTGTGTGTGATGASGTPSTTTDTTTSSANANFQIGVRGDNSRLTIYVSRLSRGLIAPPTDTSDQTPTSDVLQITYWVVSSGDGLARFVENRVTAEDAVNGDSAMSDENSHIIAPEVKRIDFRYYDGTQWLDSWDGSEPGPDGVTPKGPPRAVEFTLGLQLPGAAEGVLKPYVHVVAFPTANGPGSSSGSGSGTTTTP